MTRKVKEFRIFEKLTIESAGAEGHSIGRHDGQVIFVNTPRRAMWWTCKS